MADAEDERPEPPCKPGSVPRETPRRRTFISDARCRAPPASLPGGLDRAGLALPLARAGRLPIRSCTAWGLPCRAGHPARGALLPHRFTLATHAGRPAPFGGLFSVALSCGSPRPAVGRHAALWCPDFPRRPPSLQDRRVRPGGSGEADVTRAPWPGNRPSDGCRRGPRASGRGRPPRSASRRARGRRRSGGRATRTAGARAPSAPRGGAPSGPARRGRDPARA